MSKDDNGSIMDEITEIVKNSRAIRSCGDGKIFSSDNVEVDVSTIEDFLETNNTFDPDKGKDLSENELLYRLALADVKTKGVDEIIDSEDTRGVVKQSDGVVSWELDGLYKENGDLKSSYGLLIDPPVFRFTSSSGDFVEFRITKELARELNELFSDTYKGFYGIDTRKKEDKWSNKALMDKMSRLFSYLSSHLISIFFVLFIVIAVVIANLF